MTQGSFNIRLSPPNFVVCILITNTLLESGLFLIMRACISLHILLQSKFWFRLYDMKFWLTVSILRKLGGLDDTTKNYRQLYPRLHCDRTLDFVTKFLVTLTGIVTILSVILTTFLIGCLQDPLEQVSPATRLDETKPKIRTNSKFFIKYSFIKVADYEQPGQT